ncbi:hypothetical protein [uncultured Sphingomonas sp.]|uniref:hypothetical protein n=1 Tax=uncultured Sphingomonas sp. TaxID=158754 RepID=UPI0035CBF9C6
MRRAHASIQPRLPMSAADDPLRPLDASFRASPAIYRNAFDPEDILKISRA